jgi:hypothetical protein
MLHRRVAVSGFAADPEWSVTQADPAIMAPDLVETIRVPGPGTLLWWGIGKDGADANASSVDGSGATLDARLVIRTQSADGRGYEYLGFTPISVTLGGLLPWGQAVIERDLPSNAEGWLQMISLGVGASAATHLWLSYRFIRGAAVGV